MARSVCKNTLQEILCLTNRGVKPRKSSFLTRPLRLEKNSRYDSFVSVVVMKYTLTRSTGHVNVASTIPMEKPVINFIKLYLSFMALGMF